MTTSQLIGVALLFLILVSIFSYVLFTQTNRTNQTNKFNTKPIPPAPEQGKKLYEQFCTSCHGQSGKGDGPAAAALNPKPRDYTNKEVMSKLSDDDLFNVIKNGGASVGKSPLMPPGASPCRMIKSKTSSHTSAPSVANSCCGAHFSTLQSQTAPRARPQSPVPMRGGLVKFDERGRTSNLKTASLPQRS
jgi:hypothetical protein